jgi:hypothetical protein
MIYGFDTDKKHEAAAALLVYATYRSRNKTQFKISLDMWDKIERFTKSASKRAATIPEFIEKLKPKLKCHSLSPKWMEVGIKNDIGLFSRMNKEGSVDYIELNSAPRREFMTSVVQKSNQKEVLNALCNETAWIILLIRERLEREKPQENFVKEMENHA